MLVLPMLGGSSPDSGGVLTITVATNQTNFNLKTAIEALYGTVTGAVTVVCTINAGVVIAGAAGNSPAFITGGFPAGSTVEIINYGSVWGKAGDGGDGGDGAGDGANGQDGKDAIELNDETSIDNTTTGQIFGGGGGGGGGGASAGGGGGGGGGGQGDPGGSKGIGGSSGGDDGSNGSTGSYGGGGNGHANGGDGGRGGGWGSNGNRGKDGTLNPFGTGGSRGNGGRAVRKNGHSVTWLGGYNSTQVKGSVS